MRVGNLAGQLQKRAGGAEHLLGPQQSIAAQGRVLLHLSELFVGQLVGLEQNAVGHAHFSDVVKRCRLGHQVHRALVELLVARLGAQVTGQGPHVHLGAPDVPPGLVVPGFGQRGQALDRHVLGELELGRPLGHQPLQNLVLVLHIVAGQLQLQVVLDPGFDDRR